MQVFVSLILVLGSIILFLHSAKQKDLQHADRLALLPLDSEPSTPPAALPSAAPPAKNLTESHQ